MTPLRDRLQGMSMEGVSFDTSGQVALMLSYVKHIPLCLKILRQQSVSSINPLV